VVAVGNSSDIDGRPVGRTGRGWHGVGGAEELQIIEE